MSKAVPPLAAAIAAISAFLLASPVTAQSRGGEPARARIGAEAPSFVLPALDGQAHGLAAHRGKLVVLEWISPDCPYVAKHHERNPTVRDLLDKFSGRGVVWLAVASREAADPPRLAARAEAWGLTFPVLLDHDGVVADAYAAHATPHVFVIDPAGVLRYSGAIDDNWSPDTVGATNYVEIALSTLLAGGRLERTVTVPYGCPIRTRN
ncbi:MAG: redoxin domain-containing protein [Planctomycetes bacterium]|nr:redoxin domain-containing protein [Planctomycetota bacterium]